MRPLLVIPLGLLMISKRNVELINAEAVSNRYALRPS
jgi:hypothetical protein